MGDKLDDELEGLAQKNQGELDIVLLMFLGACGNDLVRPKLSVIYPGLEVKQWKDEAELVVRAIWSSSKKQGPGGKTFALQALYESQIGDLANTF